MDSLLWFILSLVLLVNVVRWIHRHMHGIAYLLTGNPEVALVLYALPLFPGVMLHELSHTLMAFLLRVRTAGFSVLPRRDADGHVALGSVMVEQVDVVRASLIGAAPLLFGCGAVLLIGQHVFNLNDLSSVLVTGEGPAIANALGRLFQAPDAWLWLYLIFALSNAMLPSASDRETWPPVILFIVGVFVLALVADQGALVQALTGPVNGAIAWLTAAFAITLAVDLPVMFLIYLAERGAESIRGQRVYYSAPSEEPPKRRKK
ncbi:MAG TPA: hypothetical protein VJG32_05730 [Anaerolineae bacterium]|nr:hypothetical protein [Anaerolineae bacterium]